MLILIKKEFYSDVRMVVIMKLVKRISIFFIVSVVMFCAGVYTQKIASDRMDMKKNYDLNLSVNTENDNNTQQKEEALEETSVLDRQILDADTICIIEEHDVLSNNVNTSQEKVPASYIGMNMEEFIDAMNQYSLNPTLDDKAKGLVNIEVENFAGDQVTIKKFYEKKQEMKEGFVAVNENNMVTIYCKDQTTKYMDTSIKTEDLPDKIKSEIINVKNFDDETELFQFLESYSS